MRASSLRPARAALLLLPLLVAGCDGSGEPEAAGARSERGEEAGGDGPAMTIELGESMPAVPAGVETSRRSYGGAGDVVELRGLSNVVVVTYEGERFDCPTALTKVFLSDQGRVETVFAWVLPRPMPWNEAVAWFEGWLETNQIEPGEELQRKLAIWTGADVPGNEKPNNLPRHETATAPLTPTSALSLRFKPHPVRDWKLVLSVGLNTEELGKLEEKTDDQDQVR